MPQISTTDRWVEVQYLLLLCTRREAIRGPHAAVSMAMPRLYIGSFGIADDMSIARVWACRRRCRYRAALVVLYIRPTQHGTAQDNFMKHVVQYHNVRAYIAMAHVVLAITM